MATAKDDDKNALISKGFFGVVSEIVGPECVVKVRRQCHIIHDEFRSLMTYLDDLFITSGSRGEGFEFSTSDIDAMHVDKKVVVVTSSCLLPVLQETFRTVLLMETDNVSPGFALLKCLTHDSFHLDMINSLVWRGNDAYISSESIRENFMRSPISVTHGPCQTFVGSGIEMDDAYTVNCKSWPKSAQSFVSRSLDRGWPSYDVLTGICKDGCLLVPINSKDRRCRDLTELEWRISFSLAERKLTHSMNHCQFLCYGLSKLVLKEYLNKIQSIEDLLCSYFLKTALFWEISEKANDWSPQNFLSNFWNVIRRLMQWVSAGYCPSFFVPENNMFYGKIYGEKQGVLLKTLRELYLDGHFSLLRCPSLREKIPVIHAFPHPIHLFPQYGCVRQSYIEKQKIIAVTQFKIPLHVHYIKGIISVLINACLMPRESEESSSAVKLLVNHSLQTVATHFLLFPKSKYLDCTRNRKRYIRIRTGQRLLSKAKTFFCMNFLHYAKCAYMTGQYHKAVQILIFIKKKLLCHRYMYQWKLDDEIVMSARQLGMPYDELIKTFVINYIMVDGLERLEELRLEHLAVGEATASTGPLSIPPLVFLNFLLFLSYSRLGENQRLQDTLHELHSLLHSDNGYHIWYIFKGMAWEILGICQQRCGDRHGALQSYNFALNDKFSTFQKATQERIETLGDF